MLVPPWDQSTLGTTVDLVLQSVLQDCEGHAIMRILGTQQHVEVQDVQLDQQAVFTFLNLQVMAVTPRPVLQVTKETRQFVHPPTSYASVCKCIELCAGAGFMSQGATACGYQPIIGVEKNSRFASLYSLQHDGKFICKDIGSTEAIAEALSSGASGVTLLSGFSCQPYSCAGDRKGFRDSRADALPSSLRFAWLVQAPVIILECTPLAKDDPNVQAVLANFLQLSGFQINQVILRLSNCWAARRDRWWCVMMPQVLGSLSIPDLPIMPEYQVVGGIMPYIRHWPEKDIAELILSLQEHLKFLAYAGPLESLALDFKKPLPTALHAWGNQIYPCGCGCRSGLSEERLRTKGLHGVLIPGKTTLHHKGDSFPECRHVHPAEVLLLCGGRPDLSFDSMRLGLAAVGQLASPIQSLWILSHVRQAIASFAGESSPDPHQLLCEYQNSLLAIRDKMWPVIPTPSLVPTRTEQHLVDSVDQQWVNLRWEGCLDDAFCRALFSPGQTLENLCEAEANFRGVPKDGVQVLTTAGTGCATNRMLISGETIVLSLRDFQPEAQVPEVPKGHQQDTREDNFGLPSELPMPPPVETIEPPGNSTKDRLCHVPKEGLIKLLIPSVATAESLQGLRNQMIDLTSRKTVLETQEDLWADDQIFFHLTNAAQQATSEQGVHVWDPLAVTGLFRSPHSRIISSWAENLPPRATIVTAVLANHHWVPIVWRWADGVLDGFSYGITPSSSHSFEILHQWVCKALGADFTPLSVVPTAISHHCGVVAIAYVRHLLLAQPMVSPDKLENLHQELCRQFVHGLDLQCPRPWIWGRGIEDSTPDSALIALLRQHGVPASETSERATQVCRTIGKDKVAHALQQHAPWKELKWLANQCIPMLKLVRPSELQQAISSRAQSTASVGSKNLKKKGQGKGKSQVGIDPTSIRIPEGTFVTADSKKIGQIPVSQIGPLQEGVVMATLDQALPYISQNRQVSLGGLCIIVLNQPEAPPGIPLISEKVTFPAVCAANSEPLIVTGSLFQLGAKPVTRASADNLLEIRSIQTSVLKLSVYRDVLGVSWAEFCTRPMHHILQLVPPLVSCREEGCTSCQHWHEGVSDVKDPILAVWNRQWLTHAFATVPSEEADFYSITIRVPSELEATVLSLSGSNAVCVEPRELDGRQVSKAYQVIWLPRHTAAQAMVLRQTIAGIIGLARLGQRWGVRCRVGEAASVHQLVKPDAEYLPSGHKQVFLLGPVPFGTLKQSVVEACKKLKWSARPLQAVPAARNVSGIMWKIQALEPPPCNHLQLASGDVVITRFDHNPSRPNEPQPVVGSAATKQLCQADAGQDFLQIHDPWAKAIKSKGEIPADSEVISGPSRALEEQVVQTVLSRLPTPMVEDDHSTKDERISALELKVQQLAEQGQSLQHAFQEQAVSQQQQLNVMQTQFQSQQTILEHAVHEQGIQLQGLSGQLQTQLTRQESRLDDMFAAQMSKIEDLLGSKKQRYE